MGERAREGAGPAGPRWTGRVRAAGAACVATLLLGSGAGAEPAAGAELERGSAFEIDAFDELLLPMDAPADERAAVADNLAAEGRAALEAHDYEVAARNFEGAYRLAGDPALLHPLSRALAAVGRYAAAAERLERYVLEAEGLEPEQRSGLERELEGFRRRYARVTIVTEPEGAAVTIDGEPVGTTPFASPLLLNNDGYRLEVRLEGYEAAVEDLAVTGGGVVEHRVQLEPVSSRGSRRRPAEVALWTMVGLAAATTVATAVAGGLAAYRYDLFVNDLEYRDAHGRGEVQAAIDATYALAGATVALAAVAVTLGVLRALGAGPWRARSRGARARSGWPSAGLELVGALAPAP